VSLTSRLAGRGQRRLVLAGWAVLAILVTVSLWVATGPPWGLAAAAVSGLTGLLLKLSFEILVARAETVAVLRDVASRVETLAAGLEPVVDAQRKQSGFNDGILNRIRAVESAAGKQSGFNDAILNRIRAVESAAGKQVGFNDAILNRARALEAAVERQAGFNDAVLGRTREVEKAVGRFSDSILERTRSLEKAVGRQGGFNDSILERTRSLEKAAHDLRSERILAFARHTSEGLPGSILLQVCIHRSGSTWLYDVLRTHPAVYVEPTNIVWDLLGLHGRRYPAGLSDIPSASLDIEIEPGAGAQIPAFEQYPSSKAVRSRWAIEKVHPQFFGFESENLATLIDQTEREQALGVQLVYGIRDPLQAMWSMAEYKEREPGWYHIVDMADVPGFILRSIVSLSELAGIRPGWVVDFTDIGSGGDVLRAVGRHLGGDWPDSEAEAWVEHALSVTDRARREQRPDNQFLGREHRNRIPEGPDGLWKDKSAVIEEAQAVYQAMLDGREI